MFKLFQKKKVKLDDSRDKLREQVYNTMYPSPCSSQQILPKLKSDPNKWLQNANDISFLSRSLEQDIDKILRITVPKSKKPTPRNSIDVVPEKSPPRNVEQKRKTWYVQQQIEKKQDYSKLQINMNQIICEFPIQNVPNSTHDEPKTPAGSKEFIKAVLSKKKEQKDWSLSREKDYLFQDQKSLAENFSEQELRNNKENAENQQIVPFKEEIIKPNKKKQNAKKTNPPPTQEEPPQKQSNQPVKQVNSTQNQQILEENLPLRQENPQTRQENIPIKQEIFPIREENIPKRQENIPIRQESLPNKQSNLPVRSDSISFSTNLPEHQEIIQENQDSEIRPPAQKVNPPKKKKNQRYKKKKQKAKPRVIQVQENLNIIEEKTKQIKKAQTLEPVIFNVKQTWSRMQVRREARKLEITKTQQFKDLSISINAFHVHPSEGELRLDHLRPMQNQAGKYFQSFELWINPYVLIGPLRILNVVKLHIRFKKGYSGEVFCNDTLSETIPLNQADGKTIQQKLILANNSDHVIKLVCCLVNIPLKKQGQKK